ncbi:MAG: HlyD family type I secretion periplasmic adaptor subunit [Sulfitobacter sp.]
MSDLFCSARRPVTLGFAALAVLVVGFGAWAVLAGISSAVVASGRIEVERNRQIIQHETGGTVSHILATEGDTVKAGELLIRFDNSRVKSRLEAADGQLFELMARRSRLIAERDQKPDIKFPADLIEAGQANAEVLEQITGQRNLFAARRDTNARKHQQLIKRRDQVRNQIVGMDAQHAALREQVDLIEKRLQSERKLLSIGLIQSVTVMDLQREMARLKGSMGELDANRAEAEVRISEIEVEGLKIVTVAREEAITRLRDLRYRELELRQQRGILQSELQGLEIRAPVSGVIYGMQVFAPRSVVRAAEPIMYLVPQDRPLIIVSRVAVTDVDEISRDQPVILRLSSLDQSKTPELSGRVVGVSADAIENPSTKENYYRVEIALNADERSKLPARAPLIPGMPVDVYFRTGERSPLAYLAKPLIDYFAKAFRET